MVELTLTMAALPMLLVAAAIIILGIIALARERAAGPALAFATLTLTISIWLVAIGLTLPARSFITAFAFARSAYIGVALIPAAVLQFTLALLDATKKHARPLAAAWVIGIVFVILFTSTDLLLAGTWHYSWGFYPHLREASALFLAYFAVVLASALYMLGTAETYSERERRRNRALSLALSVGYAGSIDFLPAFGIDLYPVGCVAILGFIVLVARALFRYQLRDLSPSFVARRLLQTMHGGVIVVDTRGGVRVTNDVAAHLLGWTVEEMRQLDLCSLLGVKSLPATDSESFAQRSITRDRLVRWRRKDGEGIELSLSASSLRDDEGNALGVLYAIADVSDRRRAEANEYKATHDLLTMLPNRGRFISLFEESKQRIRNSGRTPAVLFVDLDGFKAVNDEYGHAAGDALLQMVAKRIRNCIRGDDLLARYGGDEFAMSVDLANADDATFVGTKLLRVIGEPYSIDERQVTIGASIGAAFYPTDGATAEELLRSADVAMYHAKRDGKGRVRVVTGREEREPTLRVRPATVDTKNGTSVPGTLIEDRA